MLLVGIVIPVCVPIIAPASASGEAGTSGTGAANCPASNPPNELTLVAGTPQTAQLGMAFAESLQVALANTNRCPVTAAAGTPVTFDSPASGPSGIFKASGSNTLTVGAGSQGTALAGMFTANDTPGGYTITATSAYGSVSFSLTNTAAGLPATLTPITRTSRSALVKTLYARPLTVRVSDANGTPIVGGSVRFALGGKTGGGSVGAGASFAGGSTQATATTNSDGLATSPRFTANSTAGTFTATASVEQVSEPASFQLRNLAAGTPELRRDGQRRRAATIDTRYPNPLRVQVTGATGRPIEGASVTFKIEPTGTGAGGDSAAGAQFVTGGEQATARTGPRGVATSPQFRSNSVAGTLSATATVRGRRQSVRFSLSNHAGPPVKLNAGAAANESTTVGDGFAIPLAVTVTDGHGNPVPGAPVTFTAPTAGAGGSFHGHSSVTVRSDKRGIAVAPPFTANQTPGGYIVKASSGHARPAAFALVNTPRRQAP